MSSAKAVPPRKSLKTRVLLSAHRPKIGKLDPEKGRCRRRPHHIKIGHCFADKPLSGCVHPALRIYDRRIGHTKEISDGKSRVDVRSPQRALRRERHERAQNHSTDGHLAGAARAR
jgi:hypothetical protein